MNARWLRRGMGWWPPFRAQASSGDRLLPEFEVDVTSEAGEVVAKVHKTLYVRLKPRHRPA